MRRIRDAAAGKYAGENGSRTYHDRILGSSGQRRASLDPAVLAGIPEHPEGEIHAEIRSRCSGRPSGVRKQLLSGQQGKLPGGDFPGPFRAERSGVRKELQGEKVENKIPAIIDINVTAYIPDEWVGSAEQKMIEYKRLADVKNQQELDYIIDEWKDRFSKSPEPVENLIKLIKLRLAATDSNISMIRENNNEIRIYTPYTQPEWRIIYLQLSNTLRKNIKFMLAPKSCKDGISILLLNNQHVNFDEIFNMLTDLFYYINKVRYEYSHE